MVDLAGIVKTTRCALYPVGAYEKERGWIVSDWLFGGHRLRQLALIDGCGICRPLPDLPPVDSTTGRVTAAGHPVCCLLGMIPTWLHTLSIAALLFGAACALVVTVDVVRHPQKMGVMNIVWPVTALFGTLLTVWGYFHYGRDSTREAMERAKAEDREMPAKAQPFAALVAKGALHCGAGCMIGDILAEWLAFLVPGVAVWFGWHTIFEEKIFAVWVLDFIFAFGLGIVFQYFAIVPMRGLSPGEGIVAALKADTLSLTSWQVGMYGFMAFAQFVWFKRSFGHEAAVDTVEFWFAMQLAMVAGFVTAYPVNWWLIKSGIKEKM